MISDLIHYFGRLILLCLPIAMVVACLTILLKLWTNPYYRQSAANVAYAISRNPVGRFLQKIQFQMMVVFGISVLVFILATNVSNFFFGRIISAVSIDYSNSVSQVDNDTQQMVSQIENPSYRSYSNGQPLSVPALVNQQARQSNERIYILDASGKVVMASDNVEQTTVSMQKLIQESANTSFHPKNCRDCLSGFIAETLLGRRRVGDRVWGLQ